MDFRSIPAKMLAGQNMRGNTSVDVRPLLAKLKEVEEMAKKYQSGTPARIDFSPIIMKAKQAQVIGMQLQAKANSGKL